MDAELLGYEQQKVCEEVDIDPPHASRLRGRAVAELRDDARRLGRQLGYDSDPVRDTGGRFVNSHAAMNAAIRAKAGRR